MEENGGAGDTPKKTEPGEFLKLFSQPQVRSRVIAIQKLFQEATRIDTRLPAAFGR